MRDVIVLDSGSHSTKVGFSGESLPRHITPTVVGHDHTCLHEGKSHSCTCRYVGGDALKRRVRLNITRPIARGRIQNWADVEEVSVLNHMGIWSSRGSI